MKTTDSHLQTSDELAPIVAKYRDEEPLLSAPEVSRMLAAHDQLPNRSHKPIRKITMTIAGLSTVAFIVYQFLSGTSPTTQIAVSGRVVLPTREALSVDDSSNAAKKPASDPYEASPSDVKGSSAAGEPSAFLAAEDQVYADLTRDRLAALGIEVQGDTIIAYNYDKSGKLERTKLAANFIEGGELGDVPRGIRPTATTPLLMTFGDGRGAAYHYEHDNVKEWTITAAPEVTNPFREWLAKPGTPGYHLLGLTTSSSSTNHGDEVDSVKIIVVKDLPLPNPVPLTPPHFSSLNDDQRRAILQLAHYYEGEAEKPMTTWPDNLHITVDTLTVAALVEQMNQEENNITQQRIRGILGRLNALVPVLVRMASGSGKPSAKDFIFWYEPSPALFAALPPMQAARFKSLSAPACMTAQTAVSDSAEITYCVDKQQTVTIKVFDLSGHIMKSIQTEAGSGDNAASVDTSDLPTGLYIVAVQDASHGLRSKRIWVQNASRH